MTTGTEAPPSRRRHRWLLLCLLPLGFGTWVPIVAGLRARRPLWTGLGIALCGLAVAGLVLSSVTPEGEDDSLAGMLIVLPWVAGAALTFAITPSYRRRRAIIEDVEDSEHLSERRRLIHEQSFALRERERERGRTLVRSDAHAALERGVGRPDVAGADHCELIDVNHAPAGVLQMLPGIDADLARRIVATRTEVGRFDSVADLGFVLDLDPDATERLERVAIAIDP
jgi:DNA uptake protein ComE-like DNA-binding protein